VIKLRPWLWVLIVAGFLGPSAAFAQIDPTNRDLIQLGANRNIEGAQPISAYAFYYRNRPDFLDNTNLTLRLAIAPTYVDSELGIKNLLGDNTDLGIGLAGGGFADNYYEVEGGKYFPEQSFSGAGTTFSTSLYHLFDPGRLIPLNGILRGEIHYAGYSHNNDTDSSFAVPDSVTSMNVRTGFRFGGMEPVLFSAVALELSGWYMGQFRLDPQNYGYVSDPYHLNAASHLFWGRALFAYTLTNSQQSFMVNITGGGSADADRFSAYRIGSLLPQGAEFPLMLPGYYSQEFSATKFVDFEGMYHIPVSCDKRWTMNLVGGTAYVDYLPGTGQSGRWNTGVGGGPGYISHSGAWKIMLDYCYGFDAIRDNRRGSQSIGLLMQIDLERYPSEDSAPSDDGFWKRNWDNLVQSLD
jgi:hypothetical protein